jgi:hypothetical protein
MSLPVNVVLLGDSREVLKGLPDDSVDAIVSYPPLTSGPGEIEAVPFDPHVAGVAECDEVFWCVCVVDIIEAAYRTDVVDIGVSISRLSVTPLACVSVTLQNGSLGRSPIRAVIGRVSPTPSRVLVSFPVGVAARKRAEGQATLAWPSIVDVIERLSAILADRWVKHPLALGTTASLPKTCFGFFRVGIGGDHDPFHKAQPSTFIMASS